MFFDFILGTIIRGHNFPKITVEVVYQLRTKIRETPLSELKAARKRTKLPVLARGTQGNLLPESKPLPKV